MDENNAGKYKRTKEFDFEPTKNVERDHLGHKFEISENNKLTHRVINGIKETLATNGRNENTLHHKTGEALKFHKNTFRDKIFLPRKSVLNELFQNKHTRAIYNLILVFLVLFPLSSALQDIIQLKIPFLSELELIAWNFRSLPFGALIWLGMQSASLFLYYVYRIWGYRIHLTPNSWRVKILDIAFLFLAVMYHILFLILPPALIVQYGISMSVSLILLLEQIRFIMKTYAFLRVNAPKVLYFKNSEQPSLDVVPAFSKYLYFLFAPTLIYRDEYPRTSHIRWTKVVRYLSGLFITIFYVFFLAEKYFIPSTKNFGKENLTPANAITTFTGFCLPSLCIFILIWYFLFHSWHNAFAEILRFADRMFYQDWWNSTSGLEYYPKWNTIIHDWIYAFIYKDATEKLRLNKKVSMYLVFILSAFVHEYVLTFTFKFFYPVVLIQLGILNMIFLFVQRKIKAITGNLISWSGFSSAPGTFAMLYMFEYYARINCPRTVESPIQDFFIPRSWTCNVSIHLN